MKKFVLILIIPFVLIFNSCEELENLGLSNEEIVKGLKTALEVGADTSARELSATDGYYGNKLLRIPLPPEAQNMIKYVAQIEEITGSSNVEKTIKSINRSAEAAAKKAKPIFVDAITSMTVEDGLKILQGNSSAKSDFDSIAATKYLKSKTYENLVQLYAPKIDSTLDLVVIQTKGNWTTNQLWDKILKNYNIAIEGAKALVLAGDLTGTDVNPMIRSLSEEAKINENLSLGQFATGKALDGLYYKVGTEEKKIRKNPFQWGLDILDKVFGDSSVYKE